MLITSAWKYFLINGISILDRSLVAMEVFSSQQVVKAFLGNILNPYLHMPIDKNQIF